MLPFYLLLLLKMLICVYVKYHFNASRISIIITILKILSIYFLSVAKLLLNKEIRKVFYRIISWENTRNFIKFPPPLAR